MFDLIELLRVKKIKKSSVIKDLINSPDDFTLFAEVINGEINIKLRKKENKNDA